MIQSARSGKQNILEGSKAATTSKETEIKLTNVARASLEELLAVRDSNRWGSHTFRLWPLDHKLITTNGDREYDGGIVDSASGRCNGRSDRCVSL